MIRATTMDLHTLERHGLTVERFGDKGWTLSDGEGYLQIDGHGGVAPRQVDAVVEGLTRIAVGLYEPIA